MVYQPACRSPRPRDLADALLELAVGAQEGTPEVAEPGEGVVPALVPSRRARLQGVVLGVPRLLVHPLEADVAADPVVEVVEELEGEQAGDPAVAVDEGMDAEEVEDGERDEDQGVQLLRLDRVAVPGDEGFDRLRRLDADTASQRTRTTVPSGPHSTIRLSVIFQRPPSWGR